MVKKKGGGIGIEIKAYEKKGNLVVQVGNVAAIAEDFGKEKKKPKKRPGK